LTSAFSALSLPRLLNQPTTNYHFLDSGDS
jgi:hypothetical protein